MVKPPSRARGGAWPTSSRFLLSWPRRGRTGAFRARQRWFVGARWPTVHSSASAIPALPGSPGGRAETRGCLRLSLGCPVPWGQAVCPAVPSQTELVEGATLRAAALKSGHIWPSYSLGRHRPSGGSEVSRSAPEEGAYGVRTRRGLAWLRASSGLPFPARVLMRRSGRNRGEGEAGVPQAARGGGRSRQPASCWHPGRPVLPEGQRYAWKTELRVGYDVRKLGEWCRAAIRRALGHGHEPQGAPAP